MFSPDAFFPVLKKIKAILDQNGIRFHCTGGLVSVLYAEPRFTQDLDLVVDPKLMRERLEPFLRSLKDQHYLCTPEVIREAVRTERMFQVLDSDESLKIDFYPRELISGQMDRIQMVELTPGLVVPFPSRADLVASKLHWISKGGHKSRRDVRQLMRSATREESEQVRKFAAQLRLQKLLEEVLAEPDEIDA